uniref:Uncharacterized protein n=1 Tax=Cucumis sativus TaxID=3659 RepID=A0A0A0KD55_CUCSA
MRRNAYNTTRSITDYVLALANEKKKTEEGEVTNVEVTESETDSRENAANAEDHRYRKLEVEVCLRREFEMNLVYDLAEAAARSFFQGREFGTAMGGGTEGETLAV